MWCGSCLSVSFWMRNNVKQKGTNKLDLLVVFVWGGLNPKINNGVSMAPDWHD